MTTLSVNVNKIALLRNSARRDFPNLCDFVSKLVNLNVKGITVHPRPDERHVTRQDVLDLTEFLDSYPDVEFNIEGYPSEQFMELVLSVRPAQCTLVPDEPGQLTSDHGWDVSGNEGLLTRSLTDSAQCRNQEQHFSIPIRKSSQVSNKWGADRIELYTEGFAHHFGLNPSIQSLRLTIAVSAQALGLV